MPNEPRFYDVPAGTPPSMCRGATCEATIYWVDNPNKPGKALPIDCNVADGFAPFVGPGRGVSHFTTCVDVKQFSRKQKVPNASPKVAP